MAFKVYRCKRLLNISPLLILTSGTENNSSFYSEHFILIRENDETSFFPQRILKRGSLKDLNSFSINEEFMMEQALNSAIGKLEDFFFTRFKNQEHKIFRYQRPELIDCKESEIMASFLHGEFNQKQLNEVRIQTNSKELSEYIGKIISLRKFKIFSKF